jgi:hypothetical protein
MVIHNLHFGDALVCHACPTGSIVVALSRVARRLPSRITGTVRTPVSVLKLMIPTFQTTIGSATAELAGRVDIPITRLTPSSFRNHITRILEFGAILRAMTAGFNLRQVIPESRRGQSQRQ